MVKSLKEQVVESSKLHSKIKMLENKYIVDMLDNQKEKKIEEMARKREEEKQTKLKAIVQS